MNIFSLCMNITGIAIIIASVRRIAPDWAPLVSLCLGIFILRRAVEFIYPVTVYVKELFDISEYEKYLSCSLKALGIAVAVHITSETCRDLNENSAAAKVELCGKAAILLCGIPVIKDIFSVVSSLLH